jgi:hypothetical protein
MSIFGIWTVRQEDNQIINMAYNRENLLRRIIEIQDTVLEYKSHGVPQKGIYEKYIRDKYYISYSRFNEYMSARAKTELRELLAERGSRREAAKGEQLELCFNN